MADIKITVDSSQIRQATKDTAALEKANTKLTAKLDPLIRKEQEFQRTLVQVNKAVQLGAITQRNANKQLIALGAQYGKTAKQVQRMNLALVQGTRSFKRFGSVGLQQVGYQVGDFAVQLQGGTNAFVAFGQQGSQLLGIFGPMGAIAGAVLAIFTAFAAPLSQMETGTGAAADEMAKLKGELEPIATLMRQLFSAISGVAMSAVNLLANNLQKIIAYATAFAAVWLGRLGIVYGIKAATFAMATFGTVGANAFKIIRSALITTGIGALAVGLGFVLDKMLQLREATGSFAEAFALLGNVANGFGEDIKFVFEGVGNSLTAAILRVEADFKNGLANMFDALHDWQSGAEAGFAIFWKGVKNAGVAALNGIIQAFNGVLMTIYRGVDDLFSKISNLPLADQLGLTGTNLAGSGYQADLLATDVTSNRSIQQEVYDRRGSSKIAAGIRRSAGRADSAADQLTAETGPFSSKGMAAYQKLKTVLAEVGSTGTFSIQALMKAMQEAGEATGDTTEQLDEQVEAWKKYQENIEKVLDSTEQQLRHEISLIGLSKEEAELTKFIYELEKQMGATRADLSEEQVAQYDTIIALKEEYIKKTEEQAAATKKLEEAEKKVQAVSKSLASETVGALKSIVNGTKTASEAFRDMALNIIQQIMDILIWQPLITSLTNSISGSISGAQSGGGALGGIVSSIFGFQKGGAFSAGNVIPFANGGVVGSPTYFGMSGGRTGLMGEAGPEAIMPLKRGSDGKLGVEGGGNVTVHQTFNFSANGDESVKKIIAQAAPKIAQMTEAKIINSRQRGGQMRRAFG